MFSVRCGRPTISQRFEDIPISMPRFNTLIRLMRVTRSNIHNLTVSRFSVSARASLGRFERTSSSLRGSSLTHGTIEIEHIREIFFFYASIIAAADSVPRRKRTRVKLTRGPTVGAAEDGNGAKGKSCFQLLGRPT